jgi:hypothetical protein
MEQGLFKFELTSKKMKYSSEDKVIIYSIAIFFPKLLSFLFLIDLF